MWTNHNVIIKYSFFIIVINLFVIFLQNCIEQPFESQYVKVARNNEFAEEFLYNIRIIFQSLDTRMSMYCTLHNVYECECCTWQVMKTFTMFDSTPNLIFGMLIAYLLTLSLQRYECKIIFIYCYKFVWS